VLPSACSDDEIGHVEVGLRAGSRVTVAELAVLPAATAETGRSSSRIELRVDAVELVVLYMIPLKAQNGVQALWLDFEPFVYDERTLDVAGSPIHAPLKGASTVMWILKDQTAAQIASDLEEGLERRNEPLNDFRLGYALARLAESIKVMRAARAAEAGSPRRMKGSLQMLINDSWAITSYGLESVMHANAYQANWAGFGSTGRFGPTTVNVPTSVADGGLLQWGEALSWLEDRERWRVDRGPGPS
jgi:hypothetical protein